MFSHKDQTGRTLNLPTIPKRIVSLVPSQTELLFDLGLKEEVVGITKFCVHPDEWFRTKSRVGGTKKLDIEKIRSLNPDLILANKEENVQEQVQELESIAPVWVSDVDSFDAALQMIEMIGEIVGKSAESNTITQQIQNNFANLYLQNKNIPCAYLIWKDPFMTVGGDTFISDMMKRCGLKNIFEDRKRYPEISLQELSAPGLTILLSSEPYSFKEKHAEELKLFLPNSNILLVDGEMFSWYGSRMLKAAEYFRGLNQ